MNKWFVFVFMGILFCAVFCEKRIKFTLSEPELISENGSTRATGYEMSPKIITKNGKTHVGYLNKGSQTCVRTYDHVSGMWSEEYIVGSGDDNHGGPALVTDSKGYLYIFYGPHHSPFKHKVSLRPNDASEWSEEMRVGTMATYPSPFVDKNDGIHLIYRGREWPSDLMYQYCPSGGAWTDPLLLADGGEHFAVSYNNSLAIGSDGVLHIICNFFDMRSNRGFKIGYLRSNDNGKTWCNSASEPYRLPVTFDSLEEVSVTDGKNSLLSGNTVMNSHNVLFFGMTVRDSFAVNQAYLVSLKKNTWSYREITAALSLPKGKEPNAYTSIGIDKSDNMFIFVPVQDKGKDWGDVSTETYTLISEDNGASFVQGRVEPPGPVPVWLPVAERFAGHNDVDKIRLIYTKGFKGSSLKTEVPTKVFLKNIIAGRQQPNNE